MKKITIDKIRGWRGYQTWTRDQKINALGGQESLTPLEFCDLKTINASDKLLILLHEEFIPQKQLYLLAYNWAERALLRERAAGREPDQRSWDAIEIKRQWINGETTDRDLERAKSAAWAAWAMAVETKGEGSAAEWAAAWAAQAAEDGWAAQAAEWADRDEQLADVRDIIA